MFKRPVIETKTC